jgi:hypothetical protein
MFRKVVIWLLQSTDWYGMFLFLFLIIQNVRLHRPILETTKLLISSESMPIHNCFHADSFQENTVPAFVFVPWLRKSSTFKAPEVKIL